MTLPTQHTFDASGHLDEAALSAVADGEASLLSADALAHLDHCEQCAGSLASLALASAIVGEALAPLAREQVKAPPRLARAPLLVGLALCVVGLLPRLLDGPSAIEPALTFVTEQLPSLLSLALGALRDPSPSLSLLLAAATVASALSLSIAAIALLRITPQPPLATDKP